MTEMVTGTPSIVGFTDGHRDHGNRGWATKDTLFASTVDAGERTRDVLHGIRDEGSRVVSAVVANGVAIERNGRSAELATEKTAAAAMIDSAKNAAALNLAIEKTSAASILESVKNASAAQLFAAQNHAAALAQAAECCCEIKELIRTEGGQTRDLINANTVQGLRDALAAAQRFVPLTVPVPI